MFGARRIHMRALLGATLLCVVVLVMLRTAPSAPLLNNLGDNLGTLNLGNLGRRKATESAKLEALMNTPQGPEVVAKNSSFDWSTVKFKYLKPELDHELPRGKPLMLPKVQFDFNKVHESKDAAQTRNLRRNRVRQIFQEDWASYRKFAWKKDALLPKSGGSKEQFADWAATLVDSLDSLWLLGLRDEFEEALAAVADIDFGRASTARVNMFETTIRYLGGLLSAYDLSKRKVLLHKAVELGDLLYAGYDTPSRLPVDFINFDKAKEGEGLSPEGWVVSASPGTLSMEMTRLSQLTGDSKYYDGVTRMMKQFEQAQNKTHLPGLWPIWVSVSRLDFSGRREFTLGGSADSLYEYLPKMHALLGGLEPMYAAMTERFIAAADKYMFFRPMLPHGEDILISGNVEVGDDGSTPLDPESEHLACFIGGTVALAGKLLKRPDYVDTGKKLADGCAFVYQSFPSGVMPERYNLVPCEPKRAQSCPWEEDRFIAGTKKRPEYREDLPGGFTTAKDPRYLLRPEAIESVFYMYRITGDVKYQHTAWAMFQAVEKMSRTKYGHGSILDVMQKKNSDENLEDFMETFWFAETLKYYYLVFSPPDLVDLDAFVLNTEAHPFRRPIPIAKPKPMPKTRPEPTASV